MLTEELTWNIRVEQSYQSREELLEQYQRSSGRKLRTSLIMAEISHLILVVDLIVNPQITVNSKG